MPKYPNVKVDLVGEDGNAFAIMGRVSKAMGRAGCTPSQIKEYTDEATSGDYSHLLVTTMEYVSCDEDYEDDEEDEFWEGGY